MGVAGNGVETPERARYAMALRTRNLEDVMHATKELGPQMTLTDAYHVTSLLVKANDERAEKARVRLLGWILSERVTDMDQADVVFMLIANMEDEKAHSELAKFCPDRPRVRA